MPERVPFRSKVGRQLRHPSGMGGRAAGWLMRWFNAAPYRLSIDALSLAGSESVLDLGCGPGHGLAQLAARLGAGTVYGIDHSATMLAQARARNARVLATGRLYLREGDFGQIPLPDASLDAVLAVNVAYFWDDEGRVLAELRRVLDSDGRLVLYVTDARSMRRWPFVEPTTHRLFDRAGLAAMLLRGGFAADSIFVRRIRVFPMVTGLIALAYRPEPTTAATQNGGV